MELFDVTLPRLRKLLDAADENKAELEDGELSKVLFMLVSRLEREQKQHEILREGVASSKVDYYPLTGRAPMMGWAVVCPNEKPKDSTELWVVRVEEPPGHKGSVTRLSDTRKFENVFGLVQLYRSQARALKKELLKEKKIPQVSAADLWGCDDPYWF